MANHTPGPWLRAGLTVYALMPAGWREGVEQFKNRITITIQHDGECGTTEALACANLVKAAPLLHQELTLLVNTIAAYYAPMGCYPPTDYPDIEYRMASSRAAILEANGGFIGVRQAVMASRGSWKVLPLSGTYYGTKISINDSELAEITVWGGGGSTPRPSWREIERLPPHMTVEDILVDSHYEDDVDLSIANLISSIPDLLESNKAMVAALNAVYDIRPEMSDYYIYDSLPSSGVAMAYLAARESIRKATGGAG